MITQSFVFSRSWCRSTAPSWPSRPFRLRKRSPSAPGASSSWCWSTIGSSDEARAGLHQARARDAEGGPGVPEVGHRPRTRAARTFGVLSGAPGASGRGDARQVHRELGADLVVMTTHGRGGLRRAWLGSVTDQLIRSAEVPVLVVRPGEAGAARPVWEPGEILVALDGSPLAEAALEPAIEVARLWDAELSLVQVVRPITPDQWSAPHLPLELFRSGHGHAPGIGPRLHQGCGRAGPRVRGAGVRSGRDRRRRSGDADRAR